MVAYDHGYESLSGFREAFGRIYGDAPGRARDLPHVLVTRLLTPVGPLIAGATDEGIRMLQFGEQERLESQLRASSRRIGGTFVPGTNAMLERLDVELKEYFDGRRTEFEVPLILDGTEFQKAAWQSLCAIPYGETRSYAEQARSIGRPKAVRAVGRANGDNHITIVIPCHRVVGADGKLTGYGGGLWRKQALLEHERRVLAQGPSVFRIAQSQLSDRSCG
jgi:AraC family transcriptional regulator of adaptative response/methylated-DNA-[protein]-cysteine methyltransferase